MVQVSNPEGKCGKYDSEIMSMILLDEISQLGNYRTQEKTHMANSKVRISVIMRAPVEPNYP